MTKVLTILFLFLYVSVASATTVTLQQGTDGYSGATDTVIDYANATTNYASDTTIAVIRPFSGNFDKSGLFKFDVSSIPSTATINSATFSVYHDAVSDADGYAPVIGSDRVFKPWTEAGATHNTWDGTNGWGTVGAANASDVGTDNTGNGTDPDRTATSTDTVSFTGWTAYPAAFIDFDVTALVQAWVNGTINNNGLILRGTSNTQDKAVVFWSSENATTANRPKLVIDYTVGSSSVINNSVWNNAVFK